MQTCKVSNCDKEATTLYTQDNFRDAETDKTIPDMELKTPLCREHGELVEKAGLVDNSIRAL